MHLKHLFGFFCFAELAGLGFVAAATKRKAYRAQRSLFTASERNSAQWGSAQTGVYDAGNPTACQAGAEHLDCFNTDALMLDWP